MEYGELGTLVNIARALHAERLAGAVPGAGARSTIGHGSGGRGGSVGSTRRREVRALAGETTIPFTPLEHECLVVYIALQVKVPLHTQSMVIIIYHSKKTI